jgi:hypothetical protein
VNPDFLHLLHELVERAKKIRRDGIHGVDPEAFTKQQLIEPLLQALGYDLRDDVNQEYHILGDQCDYLLETRRPLLFVEAKNLLDKSKDLFAAHSEQVLRYLRNYRVSPEQVAMAKPVTWLLLTNFAQLHLIRVNEKLPTFSFKLADLESRADELWELLSAERLEQGRIEELYDQTQKADLDQRFLADLKQWRLILANGFGLRNQTASLGDLTSASQQLLDRFLFCRMLETHGLISRNKLARALVCYDTFFGWWSRLTMTTFLCDTVFAEIRQKFAPELFSNALCDRLNVTDEAIETVVGHTSSRLKEKMRRSARGQDLSQPCHLYRYDFTKLSPDFFGLNCHIPRLAFTAESEK